MYICIYIYIYIHLSIYIYIHIYKAICMWSDIQSQSLISI